MTDADTYRAGIAAAPALRAGRATLESIFIRRERELEENAEGDLKTPNDSFDCDGLCNQLGSIIPMILLDL